MLKLEVGKKYLNGHGKIIEIVRSEDFGGPYEFMDADCETYTDSGIYNVRYGDHYLNLVSEYIAQPRKFKQFEYQTLKNCTEDDLRSVGSIGWELVSIDRNPHDPAVSRFYFKREIL